MRRTGGPNPERDSSQTRNGRRRRRELVLEACQACRRRKSKCDALRPCTPCASKCTACEYKTLEGETRTQALKRKHDDMSQDMGYYEQLFKMLKSSSQRDTLKIVQHIRDGLCPEQIVALAKRRDTSPAPCDSLSAHNRLLVSLLHSTGSLQDLVRLAVRFTTNAQLPGPWDFQELRNRVVHLPMIQEIMRDSSVRLSISSPTRILGGATVSVSTSAQSGTKTLKDAYTVCPPHRVPASPWTTITDDDDDLHSENEIAFTGGDCERITRGLHFHDEAIRLWTLEECRPTITNMQALCILALESNYRAKDQLGLTLVPIAAQLDRQVPMHGDANVCTDKNFSEQDFVRARLSAHLMIGCTDIATAEPRRSDLPDLSSVFPDRITLWSGYPISGDPVAYRPTLYLRERCRLAKLFQEMHSLIFTDSEQSTETITEFSSAVEGLSAKMRYWKEHLPVDLAYEWPMSIAVWELHASYLAFSMLLRIVARTRLQQRSDSILVSRLAQGNLSHAIPLAHRAAQILKEFRERYGLKITPAWLLQLQAVAVNVLLLDPDLADVGRSRPQQYADDPIENSQSAFDETFRCLLGTGVEVMIARAIARMTFHTAMAQKINFSQETWSLLQMMSDTAWRPSDISLVNSVFPNFAAIEGLEDDKRMTVLLSKWESINID
ncbi:hypothetical protein Q7P37_010439 [Cladosporium fusiforme]